MILLDTNVVSELRKVAAGRAHPALARWADAVEPQSLYLSVITIQELETGVLLVERRDQTQGTNLRRWFEEQVLATFNGRVLDIDAQVARRCAALHCPHPRPIRDSLIAATALVHGCPVATRNVADFQVPGLVVVNPWDTPA